MPNDPEQAAVPSQLDAVIAKLATEFGLVAAANGTVTDKVKVLTDLRTRHNEVKAKAAASAEGKKILEQIKALETKLAAISIEAEAAKSLFAMFYDNMVSIAQWTGQAADIATLQSVERIVKVGRPPKA